MTAPTGYTRRAVLDAAVATLIAASTSAGSRVHRTRTRALDDDHSPTLIVEAVTENSDRLGLSHPIRVRKTIDIRVKVIVCVASGVGEDDTYTATTVDESMEDTLDTLADEVEDALYSDADFVGFFERVVPGRRSTVYSEEGRRRGHTTIELEVQYTHELNPDGNHPEFRRAEVLIEDFGDEDIAPIVEVN